MPTALLETSLTQYPVRRGKVRDVYDLGDQLLMVSTDRISAFDWVMPNGIPDKGRVLTQISACWFDLLDTPNHLLSMDLSGVKLPAGSNRDELAGRSMLVRKCEVVPIECVVRGYLDAHLRGEIGLPGVEGEDARFEGRQRQRLLHVDRLAH